MTPKFKNIQARNAYEIARKHPEYEGAWHSGIRLTAKDLLDSTLLHAAGLEVGEPLTLAGIKKVVAAKRRKLKEGDDFQKQSQVNRRGFGFLYTSYEEIWNQRKTHKEFSILTEKDILDSDISDKFRIKPTDLRYLAAVKKYQLKPGDPAPVPELRGAFRAWRRNSS
jgi:hypothetical protein